MPANSTKQTVVLSSGGLRGLIALALVQQEPERQRITLLRIDDGRPSRRRGADAAARQAEGFGAAHSVELSLTHIYASPHGHKAPAHRETSAQAAAPPLAADQVLLAAAAFARRLRCDRLVYPASYGLESERLSRATERLLLIEQLAATTPPEAAGEENETDEVFSLQIETPLFDLSDQQVVELGGQLGVDFSMSWSCMQDAARPCQQCRACKRRKVAFDKAGLEDPLLTTTVAAA
ncbi:MAG: 7-cyano-7-deazaguanine synthase [Phycisphaeraceae bacterium]